VLGPISSIKSGSRPPRADLLSEIYRNDSSEEPGETPAVRELVDFLANGRRYRSESAESNAKCITRLGKKPK
jgi:hypothetical protein